MKKSYVHHKLVCRELVLAGYMLFRDHTFHLRLCKQNYGFRAAACVS